MQEDKPSLEVRIPISPRPDYVNRVRLIALSIREFISDARIRVTVGTGDAPRNLCQEMPWAAELGIEWHWIDPEAFKAWGGTQHPYIATMMERFKPPFGADRVLMLDADVLAVRPVYELFADAKSVKGVMAHGSPFGKRNHEIWEALYRGFGLPRPTFDREVSGWGAMHEDSQQRYSPPYFNTGVIFSSAAVLERLYEPYMNALGFVAAQMDSYFFEQIALTLALAKTKIPVEVLPLRYNYPNQAEFDERNPTEMGDIRLLHFLRTNIVDRKRDFESLQSMQELAARRDLSGSNEIFRARVSKLLEAIDSE